MNNVKHTIVVWNDEDYNNRQEAEQDGAIYTHEIPDGLTSGDRIKYVEAFKQGLIAGGDRLRAYQKALTCEVVTLQAFTVQGRVLEWNDYTVTAWGENRQDVLKQVHQNGIVSYSADDVSWGMEGAPSGVVSEKNICIID